MRVVAGAGGVLNRASVPSQYLQGVGAVLNRTGNRTGERAASVPDAELVGCLSEGIARRGRRSAETPLRHGGLWDTERGGNAPPVPREWRNVEIPKQNASSPWPSPPKDEREPQMPVCIETSLSRQEEPYRKRTEACRGVARSGQIPWQAAGAVRRWRGGHLESGRRLARIRPGRSLWRGHRRCGHYGAGLRTGGGGERGSVR